MREEKRGAAVLKSSPDTYDGRDYWSREGCVDVLWNGSIPVDPAPALVNELPSKSKTQCKFFRLPDASHAQARGPRYGARIRLAGCRVKQMMNDDGSRSCEECCPCWKFHPNRNLSSCESKRSFPPTPYIRRCYRKKGPHRTAKRLRACGSDCNEGIVTGLLDAEVVARLNSRNSDSASRSLISWSIADSPPLRSLSTKSSERLLSVHDSRRQGGEDSSTLSCQTAARPTNGRSMAAGRRLRATSPAGHASDAAHDGPRWPLAWQIGYGRIGGLNFRRWNQWGKEKRGSLLALRLQ